MDQQRRHEWACRLRTREEVAVRRWQAVLLALVVGSVVATGMVGLAQERREDINVDQQATVIPPWPGHQHGDALYQYSVKVVQGRTSDAEVLGPGQYSTSVNIHNPWCRNVSYQVKFAAAGQNGREDTITGYLSFILGPDGVTEFDRGGFATLFAPAPFPNFIEGYFVIQCEEQLDVVAVYSGNALGNGELATIETERVPSRLVPRGRDFGAYISTGVAAWMITSVPAGSSLSVGPAPVSSPQCPFNWTTPGAAGVLWGAQWVGMSDGVPTTTGNYDYVYTFQLCCNFYNAEIHFNLWADDSAEVFFNGVKKASAMDNCGGPALAVDIADGFRVGTNVLRIAVRNRNSSSGDPTTSGMMLDGWLFAEAAVGNCP